MSSKEFRSESIGAISKDILPPEKCFWRRRLNTNYNAENNSGTRRTDAVSHYKCIQLTLTITNVYSYFQNYLTRPKVRWKSQPESQRNV